jgi:polyribonucleotide nucleotidyltransferase
MNICSCCFRRYTEKGKPQWYGWFDGSYPPEAKVRGSKWYNEAVAASLVEPDESIEELEQQMEDMSLQADAVEAEVEPEVQSQVQAEVEPEVQAQVKAEAYIETKDIKASLKARIKEIQASAKPGKMSLKDIQAAFKEITNLKTQIHML